MFEFHERIESIISNGKTFTDICARYYIFTLIQQQTDSIFRQNSDSGHFPDKEEKETPSKRGTTRTTL